MHRAEGPAFFDQRVARYRRDEALRAYCLSTKHTEDIAAQPFPFMIRQQWPVTIPIGGGNRIKTVLGRPSACQINVLRADSFSIHGNESL